MQPLDGRIAVVTGSSRGIGRAIALELAAAGADIVLHGRDEKALNEVVDLVSTSFAGATAKCIAADLADASQRGQFVVDAWRDQPVDIWVNNAGADVLTGEASQLSFAEKLQLLWDLDVAATVELARDVGLRMKSGRGGVILNMGWDQAETGMEGDSGEMFALVKGAVMAFSRSLAKSLAPNVRVNCLAPGWIRTAWSEEAGDYWQQRATAESLSGRWGTPEDVAHAARFLASPEASFITGQVFHINGGFAGSRG